MVVLKQCFLDDFIFLFLSYRVDEILKCPCTMFVTRYLDKALSFELFENMNPLMNLSVSYEFRAEVVAVVIHHELGDSSIYLFDNFVDQALRGHF